MPDEKPIDLPNDFEGVLRDLLNTPPPPRDKKKPKKGEGRKPKGKD
jgi:hypothetical protein